MTSFRWGVFGTGSISTKFVAGLAMARDASASLIVSRSLDKAQVFAKAMRVERAVVGYAKAAAAGEVDAMYIATPPAKHAEHAIACLEAGTPVLIEKPFASTADDSQRIIDAARAHSVFAMEAMWTRFLPAAQVLRKRLAAGEIGDVRLIAGNFGIAYRPDPTNGMFNAAMGGGAIAHLGTYPLSLGQWLFGTPQLIQATGTIGDTGVDEDVAFQLRYAGGVTGSFFASLRAWAPDDFRVMGSNGMIAFRGSIVRPYGLNIAHQVPRDADVAQFGWRARLRQNALVHQIAQRTARSSRARERSISHRYSGNGYQYEADAVRACVERGAVESDVMPLADSIAVARTADVIRAALAEEHRLEGKPK